MEIAGEDNGKMLLGVDSLVSCIEAKRKRDSHYAKKYLKELRERWFVMLTPLYVRKCIIEAEASNKTRCFLIDERTDVDMYDKIDTSRLFTEPVDLDTISIKEHLRGLLNPAAFRIIYEQTRTHTRITVVWCRGATWLPQLAITHPGTFAFTCYIVFYVLVFGCIIGLFRQ